MSLIGKPLRIVASGVGTVTTAGTPVQLPATRCQRVLIQCSESTEDTKIVVGASNVDALATPIVGRILYPTQAEAFAATYADEIYVDATANNTSFSYILEA